jgi:Na+-driven multidrug efflux pump
MIFTSTVFIMRVEGKANYSILFNLVALFVNIGLDFLLVNMLHGNMIGAVIATVLAQSIGSYLAIRTMNRKLEKPPRKLNFRAGKKDLFSTAKEGISSFALNLASILLL